MKGWHRVALPILVLIHFVSTSVSFGQWSKVTSMPPSAYITAVAATGSTLFAGTTDGIYTSPDNGATWQFNSLLSNFPGIVSLNSNGPTVRAATSSGIYASTNGGSTWSDISGNLGHDYFGIIGSIGPVLIVGTYNGAYRSTDGGSSWLHSGSAIPSVLVTSFAVVGTRLMAGTASGIFVSPDSGQTWSLSDSGLTNTNVHGIAVQGTKLLAGTWGNGVFESSDSGATWTPSNTGMVGDQIVMNVYATDTTVYASTGNNGVFVSTNSGSSWTESAALPFGEAHDCVVSGGKLFVGTRSGIYTSSNNGSSWSFSSAGMNTLSVGGFAANGAKVYVATNYNGVYGSTDGGTTWNAVNGNLPYIPLGYCIAAKGSNLFFGNNSGMHRSTDAGVTWQAATTGFGGYNPVYDFLFSGSSVYSAGSLGVYVSADSAATWSPDTAGLPTLYVNRLAQSGSNFYTFPNGKGIYKSTNNGASWFSVNSGQTSSSYTYGFAKIDTSLFVAANNGLFVSTDEGGTWTSTGGQFAGSYFRSIKAIGSYLFAVNQSGLWVSGDKAQTWLSMGGGLGTLGNGVDHVILVGTTLFLNISIDGVWKRSFAELVPYVSAGLASVNFSQVRLLDSAKVSLKFKNVVGFPFTVTGLSVNHAANFQLSQSGSIPLAAADSFSVDVQFKPTVIGTTRDTLTISYAGGMTAIPLSGYGIGTSVMQVAHHILAFGTVKTGQFKDTTVAITNLGTDTLKITGTSSSSGMFVARTPTLIVPPGQSKSDTLRFSPGSGGPASGSVVLASNSTSSPDTILVSGTGVVSAGVDPDASTIPNVYTLGQNYPNPFNPSTTILYGLPERSQVRLQVYNALGQMVAELGNKEEEAGFHSVVWTANTASGLYFYRMVATSVVDPSKHFSEVKKLLFVK